MTWHLILRSLFTLRPGPWRWSRGVTAALGMGLPLLLFTLAGHQALGLMTLLGGFTVLYGDRLRWGERLKALPVVGLGFVLASTLGVLCSAHGWLLAICLALVAALACAISFGIRLGAPGPMQFVLVAGISGHMAASVTTPNGFTLSELRIPAMVAVGAAIAYLTVISPLLLPRLRHADGPAASLQKLFPRIPFDREVSIITIRVIAAVTLAGVASLPLGVHRAYWVVLVAGVILQASHVLQVSVLRSFHRVLGTLLGLGIFWLIMQIQPSGLWLVLVVSLLQFATEVVVARNYAFGLLFITPMALIIAAAGQESSPRVVVSDRIIDTLLGIAIAMTVLLVDWWVRSRRIST